MNELWNAGPVLLFALALALGLGEMLAQVRARSDWPVPMQFDAAERRGERVRDERGRYARTR